jgi:hypothetical protein
MKSTKRLPLSLCALWILRGVLCYCIAFSCTTFSQAAEPTREELDFFENDIRPLLAKHCFSCHGDNGKHEGELRLNSRPALLQGGASGPAAVPGKPKESLLIEAVHYRDLQMPPNGKLPDAEVAKLVKWVELGLPWPKGENPDKPVEVAGKKFSISETQRAHWAFQPIAAPVVSVVDDPDWSGNSIDRFLYAAMKKQNLQPNGLADRSTLLRRVTYDLTGLPPSPEELKEFLASDHTSAWEKVVERLLASPQYGERWGRHWLDVVRYADTAGDASDYPLPDAYKYRNYVIQSIAEDKPYDQFLREQFAGDLLAKDAPPEKFEGLTTATTYLALARRFGYNDTNFAYFHLTIHDLVDNMGQAVLGLSVGCARCHDHKFEPVTASDYYALYGIFSSTKFTFAGAEEVRFPKDLIPLVPAAEAARRKAARDDEVAAIDRSLRDKSLPALNLEGSFEVGKTLPPLWKSDSVAALVATSQSPFQNVLPAGSQVIELPNVAGNLGFRRPMPLQTPQTMEILHVNLDFRNVSVAAGGEGRYRICLDNQSNFSPAVELFVNGAAIATRNGDAWRELAPLEVGTWYNLQFAVNWQSKTFSGTISNATRSWTFADIPLNPSWDGTADSLVIDGHATDVTLVRPSRQFDNIAISTVPFPGPGHVTDLTLVALQEQLTGLQAEYEQAKKRKESLAAQILYPTAYAVSDGVPANTRLQFRGEPTRLGDEVSRGFLEILGGEKLSPEIKESGRRQLAQWLTSPSNPLTARVMVNRVWLHHFGRGIVPTPNDFGVRGEPPTHPELLDYLATGFMKNGWSLKALHREILLSRAYQLSSSADSVSQQSDSTNRWLWRFQRRRLDAEELRDSLLLFSGDLDLTPGGQHPFPPIPSWGFSQHNPFDATYESRKRSLYLMTQRIKRHPFLALFDGADPNSSTGKRESTTTPSQALFLMNDPFVHQQTIKIAQRLLEKNPDQIECVKQLLILAYSRPATEIELSNARSFLERYGAELPAGSDRAALSLAAYARSMLSSNEFLFVD